MATDNGYIGHTLNIDSIATVGNLSNGGSGLNPFKSVQWRNQYDEFGALQSLVRFKDERNWEFRRRIKDAAVNLSNSSYRGLINAITRDLGLTLFNGLEIRTIKGKDSSFLARDPCVLFQGPYLYLYSDYSNEEVDVMLDRFEPGNNFETIGSLIDGINTYSRCFRAFSYLETDTTLRSMCILNQTNRVSVNNWIVPNSNRFFLGQTNIVIGSVFFSNNKTFKNEVSYVGDVTAAGKYYIDYTQGIITSHSISNGQALARYIYVKTPFYATASPIIIHELVSTHFMNKLFEQILLDDGTYADGQLTPLGILIISELLTVTPMYWGE